ncbi:PKD domain-containing protein [Ramlibacter ginsenosidimutans]|uniref:PKD domain-containing protein n=1 Tax=Ramlibacter ginsenosidimutans TaxID=502333 RepID=A0A934TPS6_9BURK|nr:PKD domain-containing protein [Ramlibacter ginsenosidimutans]MBK6004726.1 PKD domain-containing protein [Ramlibacter ginsenosidimutans]
MLLALGGCGGGHDAPTAPPQQTPQGVSDTPNALFQVGAAVVDISPTTAVTVGGYSDPSKQAITVTNDPLQVRAFVVANGTRAVAFAVVDSTGWFADYQGSEAGYGQVGARVDAATALAAHGFTVDRSGVMVSTTHSHATPTLVGIWGSMTPANRAYVKTVHDAVVRAVDQAAANLKTSELWTANGDISSIIWQNGQGTDHVDGFTVDARMPVLWARDPQTGATNALYVNIPNHPDEFRPFNGSTVQGFSADVPGYVRKNMDDTVGGIAVVGSGTLGRQESPGTNADYAEVSYQGEYVANALRLAMAKAAPLKSNTLASAETLTTTITVGNSPYNQGLLRLMAANGAYGAICLDASGNPSTSSSASCSIPRALAQPWCNGACSGSGATTLGTYITALRIGPLMYVSNPGEAFAEVNDAIRAGVVDAQSVNVVGLAGDFLGYAWNPSDYTVTQFGSSDFAKYNVGPDLAQKIADAGYANAATLGFQVQSAAVPVHAPADTSVAVLPGIQFYPTRIATTPGTSISFYGSTAQPQVNYNQPNDVLSALAWDFGDGTAPVASNSQDRLTHAYGAPGTYNVKATVTDSTTGKTRSWKQTLTILPPLALTISVATAADPNYNKLTVSANGGQGTLLAARWTCPGGATPVGLSVTCRKVVGASTVSVQASDGAGTTATGQQALP